ncbi:MAG: DNA recombination protein RmuC [Elusimicrobia bacterium]|nr:DNA recombination protein RmuC [Elusimicrobiota bacterium]MBD3412460.1 DNA recombination protein RmuC [Elusimicrobiota bacterium]
MTTMQLIVLMALVILMVWLIIEWRLMGSRIAKKTDSEQSLLLMQQQMNHLTDRMSLHMESVHRLLTESEKAIGDRLSSTAVVFGDMKKEIGSVARAAEQIFAVGKDISSLQDLLKSPKLRGNFGEYLLGEIVRHILPQEFFTEQHQFSSGETVDMVIMLGNRLLPVDAKFPLENFQQLRESITDDERARVKKTLMQDVKKHIQSIADKYILPAENTFDFAFMYIPAENVYYEFITGSGLDNDILQYSMDKKVFLVSPATLCAYLKIIVLGLKGIHIEENAQVILQRMGQLKADITRFQDDFALVGKHLGNASTKYSDAEKKLIRMHDTIRHIDQ